MLREYERPQPERWYLDAADWPRACPGGNRAQPRRPHPGHQPGRRPDRALRAGHRGRPGGRGYLTRTRTGRRVVYTVNRDSLFRHSAQDGHRVGPFLDILAATGTEVT